MTPEVVFKTCTKHDIERLIAVSQQFYPEHYTHIWKNNDPSYYINLSFNRNVFQEDFEVDNIIYFLIEQANKTRGMLKIRKHEGVKEFDHSEALQLEKIYLLKESTGLGIGKKGIEFIKDYARTLNKKIIWLDVMTTSPALLFYQKLGFQTISFYDIDYPGLKDGYREMQRMILTL